MALTILIRLSSYIQKQSVEYEGVIIKMRLLEELYIDTLDKTK